MKKKYLAEKRQVKSEFCFCLYNLSFAQAEGKYSKSWNKWCGYHLW